MQYNKTPEGRYELLKQKNVDTGMGVERTVAVLNNKNSVYEIDTFKPIIEKIKQISKIKSPNEKQEKSIRVIVDHAKASTFIMSEEISPSNVDRGYVLRRLVRRCIRHGKIIGIEKEFLGDLVKIVVDIYKKDYPLLEKNEEFIFTETKKEELKFRNTLGRGLKKFEEIAEHVKKIDGEDAFLLFQSFGFPIEMTKELAKEHDIPLDERGFEEEFKKHQEISRIGAEKKFKGGLADTSEQTTRLHTATHLLNEALRRVLNRKDIVQRGSNITPERLRFDFNFDRKLTEEELKEVEKIVNDQIKKALPVKREEMTLDEAKKTGAQAVFDHRYGERVSVYFIGSFSKEICAGLHVKITKELGKFEIIKEEAVAAGIRRIKARLK
jgi:alanyl-tRNA synthetase